MKNFNFLTNLAVYLILIIMTVAFISSCDNKRIIKQKIEEVKSIVVAKSESKKQEWIFNQYKNYVFGVDFSHYQGLVDWDKIKQFKNKKEISFAVVRATMGSDRKDNYFTHNWRSSKRINIIRGAYHYYRPNENSTKQAENYIKRVKLKKGDLPPILDIEKVSSKQSINSLRIGLLNWLELIEQHYGVKPIIYSGDEFYNSYLSTPKFEDYYFWIANYNNVKQPKTEKWKFWQFSEKGNVKGINEYVDLNVFRGTKQELNKLLIKN